MKWQDVSEQQLYAWLSDENTKRWKKAYVRAMRRRLIRSSVVGVVTAIRRRVLG